MISTLVYDIMLGYGKQCVRKDGGEQVVEVVGCF